MLNSTYESKQGLTLASTRMIPPHRIQFEKSPYYCPYRDTCAVDVLQNYKCGEGFSDEIKVCWMDSVHEN